MGTNADERGASDTGIIADEVRIFRDADEGETESS